VLVARRYSVPSFLISDYEHANFTAFRLGRSTILHPDVIDSAAYWKMGFPKERVIPFRGLKEDLTFAGVDLDAIEPIVLPGPADTDLVRVLVRPPASESHYHSEESTCLYLTALEHLGRDPRALVVLVPRYACQAADLGRFDFANAPVVLDRPVPFVSLLKAVDLVLCSGGTMLREAAYLGIPAYSIFRGRLGGVDKYLHSIGRAVLLSSPEALEAINLVKAPTISPLASNPDLVDEIAEIVMGSQGAAAA
jgi:predicted glycosyltransferase